MTGEAEVLLSELNGVLRTVSRTRHIEMLRQVANLFLSNAPIYTAEQREVFDVVIKRLAQNVSSRDLIDLSGRLAAMDAAPADTVAQLSASDDIAVSGPILEKSNVLTDNDLIGIAKTKSQNHLMAIANRRHINAIVTDVLVDRGDSAVKQKVLTNEGAEISEFGFACLVSAASKDRKLAEIVAKRDDVPAELQSFLSVALAS
ncbi:DUF2336 domain-containing protein [Pseudolabrys taiwanensis]|uniref:DUF2336 domain-containing protein n=1 Tax=Pseudolabrys taiwanensis TaxID=331696 RepID=A0A345ZT74_9HYPH|nr:DUF2336 domain-containing protein [Pseudolabrys taiwanensis]AXK80121.1 DUF2336 domain-containing protein [Pseudolabrys taiwanensis]